MMTIKSLKVKTFNIFEGSKMSRVSGMWLKLIKDANTPHSTCPRHSTVLKKLLLISENMAPILH